MQAIVDNDVAAKLARFGLLNAFQTYLNKRKQSPLLQPSIDGTFNLGGKGGALKKLSTEAQRQALAQFAAKCGRVTLDDCGQSLVQQCHLVEDIGPGDSIWLSAGACDESATIYTGDKRALKAAARSAACAEIALRLAGRVVCLEQLVLDLIEQESIGIIRTAVLSDAEADAAIAGCFSADWNKAKTASALEALRDRLKADAEPLLRE